MKRKLFLIVVVGCLMLAFVSCGTNTTEQISSAVADNESVQNDVITEEPTEATTEEELSDPVYVKSVEIVDRSAEREGLPSLSFDKDYGYGDFRDRKDEKTYFRDYIDPVIKNNTDKTITGVVVCYTFWDENNNPIRSLIDNGNFQLYNNHYFYLRTRINNFEEICPEIKKLYSQYGCNSISDVFNRKDELGIKLENPHIDDWQKTFDEWDKLSVVARDDSFRVCFDCAGITEEKAAYINCQFIGFENDTYNHVFKVSNGLNIAPNSIYQYEITTDNQSIASDKDLSPLMISLDSKTPAKCKAIVSEYVDSDGNLYTNPELKEWCIKYAGNVLDETEGE